jgi:general stress protein YciG
MPNSKRGFASMDAERRSEIASMGGRSQGKHNNPANFANRPSEEVRMAGRQGGLNRGQNSDNNE